MDRLAAHHPRQTATAGPNHNPAADQLHRIPAANRLHRNVAVGIDVLDNQPDLIAMTGEKHPRFTPRVRGADDIAMRVGLNGFSAAGQVFPHQILHRLFVARRARCFENLDEKIMGSGIHGQLLRRVKGTGRRRCQNSRWPCRRVAACSCRLSCGSLPTIGLAE